MTALPQTGTLPSSPHAVHLLALISMPGIGHGHLLAWRESLARLPDGDTATLLSWLATQQQGPIKMPPLHPARLKQAASLARDRLAAMAEQEVIPLILGTPGYPERLARTPGAPILLFLKGNPEAITISRPAIALIGTRTPSTYSSRVAHRLGQRLAERGIVVVSGLARGCDTAAHEGCLAAAGQTVAVLAHGLDSVYPPENIRLAGRILAEGGALISEYPFGAGAHPSHFVARDRIQSGLSQGVIVVETELAGGSMHTARFALRYGRKLGCIMPVTGEQAAEGEHLSGSRQLIKEGAVALQQAADVSRFLEGAAGG